MTRQHVFEELSGDFVDLLLPTNQRLMPDISEMHFDESVIRQATRRTDMGRIETIAEEIVHEEVEDSFEEVEVTESSFTEVEISASEEYEEEEVSEKGGSPALPPHVAASFVGSPFDLMCEFPPSEEELPAPWTEITEEKIEEGSADPYKEKLEDRKENRKPNTVETLEYDKENQNTGDQEPTTKKPETATTLEGGSSRKSLLVQTKPAEQAQDNQIQDDESDDGVFLDFAPCLDVTDDNEVELTQRLYGAMHHALDAWDLHQLDMLTPRPDQALRSASLHDANDQNVGESDLSNNSALKTMNGNNTNQATSVSSETKIENSNSISSSDLKWAARKAVDTIYPENYCVPPLANLNDSLEPETLNKQMADGEESKRKGTNEVELDIGAIVNNQSTLVDLEKFEDIVKDEHGIDTDASTSASTNTESSRSMATPSQALFWAIRGSLEAIYPAMPGEVAPISLLETDESERQNEVIDAQAQTPVNTDIFSQRLREYQEEQQRELGIMAARVPQDDDINKPFKEEKSKPRQSTTQSPRNATTSSAQEEEKTTTVKISPSRDKKTKIEEDQPSTDPKSTRRPSSPAQTEGEVRGRRSKAPQTPTSVRFDEDEANEVLSNLTRPISNSRRSASPDQTPLNRQHRKQKTRQVDTPPMVESWDDEEAQHTIVRGEIYNTDPDRYDRNLVVYERELIIVPQSEHNKGEHPTAIRRAITPGVLLTLLSLAVPFTIGTYLGLRK